MTSAQHIRQLAEAMGYWSALPVRQRTVRALIADAHGYTRQAIELALKRGSKPGKPKHPRCATCGQRMPKEARP